MDKKTKNNKKTNNNIKRYIIFFITIVLIFLVIDFIINHGVSKKEHNDETTLSNFEKIAVYKYIQDKFLNNNLLQNLANNNQNINEENSKVSYAIGYVMITNNTKVASLNDVKEAYNKIFGENIEQLENNSYINTYEYTYDERKQVYKIADEQLTNKTTRVNKIFITDIEQNGEENVVKVEILEPKGIDDFIMYYRQNSDENSLQILSQLEKIRESNLKKGETQNYDLQTNQFLNSLIAENNKNELTRKVATGELKLKVYNNDYVIESYNQQEV